MRPMEQRREALTEREAREVILQGIDAQCNKRSPLVFSQAKYKYTYFYVTASSSNQKKGFEHQMFTRCQFEMTPTFLLVDITRCFFLRHGTTRVRM